MKALRSAPPILLACALTAIATPAPASDTNAVAADRSEVRFTEAAPYSTGAEVRRRFGYTDPAPDYEIGKESFRLIVPENYSSNSSWGLFIWIDPGDDARIPPEWEPELARRRLLFVGANRAGNSRPVMDRIRLALDATFNMYRRFKIDRQRIYVAGFSGGSRVASMLGVTYADIFTGALCVCGVNFYQNITNGAGGTYPLAYLPQPRVLSQAKKSGRFVLLTGEKDKNRANTKDLLENGFKPNGFSHVLYLEVPGMPHAIPGVADLKTALGFLDPAGSAVETAAPKGGR